MQFWNDNLFIQNTCYLDSTCSAEFGCVTFRALIIKFMIFYVLTQFLLVLSRHRASTTSESIVLSCRGSTWFPLSGVPSSHLHFDSLSIPIAWTTLRPWFFDVTVAKIMKNFSVLCMFFNFFIQIIYSFLHRLEAIVATSFKPLVCNIAIITCNFFIFTHLQVVIQLAVSYILPTAIWTFDSIMLAIS